MLTRDEISRVDDIVEIIKEMENYPVALRHWTMKFSTEQCEQVVYILRHLEEYNDATPDSLSYLVNATVEFLDDLTPESNWSTNHISIGRELSRVVFFHVWQPIQYATDLPVIKERIAEIARLARVNELSYHDEELQPITHSIGDSKDYCMWRAKIRFWWD